MRELYVVALSEDGRSVVLATSPDVTTGGFRVAIDERLSRAIRGDLPRAGEEQSRESALTPMQIQARLRAGESAEEIARAAGVAVARVERFAGPVLSERARVVEAARAGFLLRERIGRSVRPLGEAVTIALGASSGIRPDSEEWTSRRQPDGRWVVTVSWYARARTRSASWLWDPVARSLSAVDPAAATLGHVSDQPDVRRPSRAPGRSPAAGARTAAARRAAPTVEQDAAAADDRQPALFATAARTAAEQAQPAAAPARLRVVPAADPPTDPPQQDSPAAAPPAPVTGGTPAAPPAPAVGETPAAVPPAPAAAPPTAAPGGTPVAAVPATAAASTTTAAAPPPPAAAPPPPAAAPAAASVGATPAGAATRSAPDADLSAAGVAERPSPGPDRSPELGETGHDRPGSALPAVDPPGGAPAGGLPSTDEPDSAVPAAGARTRDAAGQEVPAAGRPAVGAPGSAAEPEVATTARRPAAAARSGRGRASVPGWADVLLGTAPREPKPDPEA